MIRLHGQNQTLLGHLQKNFVKVADHHRGTLHQRGHFLHQRVLQQNFFGLCVGQQGRLYFQTAAQAFGRAAQCLHHGAAALVKAGNHRTIARQGGGVIIGMGYHHGRHHCFKTVALGAVTCLQSQCLHRHHRAAVQSQQTMRRAHKADGAPAGQFAIALQLVAHYFGDRQFGNRIEQGFLQTFSQAGTAHRTVKVQGLGFAVHAFVQSGDSLRPRAQGLQFFQQGRSGLAAGI